MATLMNVVKLEKNEADVVKAMALIWKVDEDREMASGWTDDDIEGLIANLPWVEPNHQMMVSDMISFFDDDTDLVPDRVYDSLNEIF